MAIALLTPNPPLNRTAYKLRLQVPSAPPALRRPVSSTLGVSINGVVRPRNGSQISRRFALTNFSRSIFLSLAAFLLPAVARAHEIQDLADLVTQVERSVVNISTAIRARRSDDDKQSKSIGSGFFIRSDGYVVTTSSMIKDDESYIVTIGSKQAPAQVVGRDTVTDVAVLKIGGTGWQAARAADISRLRTGQHILLVGSALAGVSTVADGIVSHHDRQLTEQGVMPYIAVSVPIHPGNGGAPIFNLQGEALGMVSMLYVPPKDSKFSSLAFAVPMDTVLAAATAIVEHGRVVRGTIRVTIQDVTDELSKTFGLGGQPRGALVAGVASGGPAARAGIEPGDIVLEFDGKPVKRSSDIPRLVGSTAPGSKVQVVLFRRGKMLETKVEVEEFIRP